MEINNIEKAREKAEEIAKKYNLTGISPFPYEMIERAYTDLKIFSVPLENNLSGAIKFQETEGFHIFVNSDKPKKRRYFTIAHELGHFFLHSEIIKEEKIIIDNEDSLDSSKVLFRIDEAKSTQIEKEANNFAASLIMPRDLVIKAWNILEDVEECAKIFNVSIIAMSIRLEKLHLLTE